MEVVKPWVTRVGAHNLGDVNQMLENLVCVRNHALLNDNQNSHDTSHQELILLYFLWGRILLDQLEDVLEEILC